LQGPEDKRLCFGAASVRSRKIRDKGVNGERKKKHRSKLSIEGDWGEEGGGVQEEGEVGAVMLLQGIHLKGAGIPPYKLQSGMNLFKKI